MRQRRLPVLLVVTAVLLVKVVLCQESSTTTTQTPRKNATYWVTTSNKFWPGRAVQLIAQILTGTDPVSVTVSITEQSYGVNSTVKTLFTSAATDVIPGAPRTLHIDVPSTIKVPEDSWNFMYKIAVVGKGSTVNFKHEDNIYLQTKSFSIYLVTNKGIYKPGQTVKFRALAMEPANLKVLQDPMDILITDAKGNRIKQYRGIVGTSGVVDQSFNLAASTPSGDWKISATVRGQTTEKTFTVDDYVLPKFEVAVTPPAIPLTSDTIFPITVKATYTFGQPVTNGSVAVRITMYYSWYSSQNSGPIYWKTSGKLDSKGEFTFTVTSKELADVVRRTYNYYYSLDHQQFRVEANVTEGNSQRLQAGSASMQMYTSPFTLQIVPITSASYKPEMPFIAYAEVKKSDGSSLSQLEAIKLQVHFNATYEIPIPPEEQETTTTTTTTTTTSTTISNSSGNISDSDTNFRKGPSFPMRRTKNQILLLDNNVREISETGFANITFLVPPEAMSLSLVASLGEPYNSTQSFHFASPFKSPSNNTLQLTAPLKPPKVGDTISLRTTATEPVKNLMYQVLSKSVVVSNGIVTSPTTQGSTILSFDLTITQSMTPSATIIVFYIREQDSEIVPDSVSLSIEGLFQKEVSVEFDKDKVKPGEAVNLVVKAPPESTVFVQANDRSVDLLKPGNKLTQDMVREDLAQYSFGGYFPYGRYMFICGWPVVNSGVTAASVFENAGMYFFTDGEVYKEEKHPVIWSMDKGGYDSEASAQLGSGRAPMAASNMLPAERVRKNFPETWIWDIYVFSADSNGEMLVAMTAPDTITSFVASIFSVNPTHGLSVGKDEAVVTVFRDLFVSVDLPPYIIRYEDFCFKASVFSYYAKELPVLLTLDSSDQYNGSYVRRQGDAVVVVKEKMSFTDYYGNVNQNEVRTSTFCVTPIVIGDVTLKVSALTDVPGLSDAVEQVISARPEGVLRSKTLNFLVNLTSTFWQQEAKIDFPPETVADSQRITVSVAGSLLGPMLENIQDLLRQPYGCGEQNMLNFAPSVSMARYFLVTGTSTPELVQRAVDYIEKGYQTELTYMHTTGGFSAFGEKDGIASTWLSAFVLNCIAQAANLNDEYNNILLINMTDVISSTVRFLISKQNRNGSFTEYGKVFHKEMQGGSAEGEALTAYALISLVEATKAVKDNASLALELQKSVTLATDYLAGRINALKDPFDLCITSYVLHLLGHSLKDDIFAKVEALAQTGDGLKFWKRSNSLQETYATYAWSASSDSISIEMTSYCLLVYSIRGIKATEGLPILRWLTNQKGPNSGFVSTQDTVIGIQALTRAVVKFYKPGNFSVTVTVSYMDGNGQSQTNIVHINKESENLLQKVYVDYTNKAPTSLTLTANTDNGQPGPSTVLVVVSQDFNVKEEPSALCYNMSHTVVKTDDSLTLTITVAAVTNNASSMSILEVQIPAGYTILREEVATNNNVSRVDPFNGDTVFIYYDTGVISTKGITASIKMYRTNDALTDAKPRTYTSRDYYQPNCRQTKTYTWGRDHICVTVPENGICRYVQNDAPEVTAQ